MKRRHIVTALAILVSAGACNGEKQDAAADKVPATTPPKYMKPRFPAYPMDKQGRQIWRG